MRLASGNQGGVRDIARRLGIAADLSGEAGDLALGTYETTLLDLTAAYAALANRGVPVTPYCVQEVRGNEGQRLYTRAEHPREPVIRPQHVQEMRRMLAGVVQERDRTGGEPRGLGRRQDRHDERQPGCMVRRLHRALRRRGLAR